MGEYRKGDLNMEKRKRFIINLKTKIIHDRNYLTESCNTDQIEHKDMAYRINTRYADFRRCKHCYF